MKWVPWWKLPDHRFEGPTTTLQQALLDCNREVLLSVLMSEHALFEHDPANLSPERIEGMRHCLRSDLGDMSSTLVPCPGSSEEALSPWDYSAASRVPWEVALSLPVLYPQNFPQKDRYYFLANVVWEMHAAVA